MRRAIHLTTLLFLACGTSGETVRTRGTGPTSGGPQAVAPTTDGEDDAPSEAEGLRRPPSEPSLEGAISSTESKPSASTRSRRVKETASTGHTKAAPRVAEDVPAVETPILGDASIGEVAPRIDDDKHGTVETPILGDASIGTPPPPPPPGSVEKLLEKVRTERSPPRSSPGVKAGASDDNLQFAAYLDFLAKHAGRGRHRDVSDRVIVQVRDAEGLPVHGADVRLIEGRRTWQKRTTFADGRTLVFPSQADARHRQNLAVEVRHRGERRRVALGDGTHNVTIELSKKRREAERVPLDIAFVLDTTGSMGDEILRLKQTLAAIHFQITHISPAPDVRIGMVLFRDRGDEYVVRHVPFTGDVEAFARQLATVQAGGGNDYPEDVQAGLEAALHRLKWRDHGVKIAFLVGDAPPHTDYGQTFDYQAAAQEAAERGIKIATIGASGLSETGELVWRQIAQYTMSPFVFLTYGETGDSGAGSPALVSHHVGSNWVAENLDAIIVRMVKVELAHLSPRGAPVREDFFSAASAEDVPPDTILEDLFARSVKQLLDYSVERIEPRTPTVLMPLAAKKTNADKAKLERRLMVGLSRRSQFQLLERGDQQKLLATLADQLSEKYEASNLDEVGKLVPAKLAVLSSVAPGKKGEVEMLVKLVRLETGEVLSLSLLKIDEALVL